MELSPFLVTFLFVGCTATECRLTYDVMFTKEDIEVEVSLTDTALAVPVVLSHMP